MLSNSLPISSSKQHSNENIDVKFSSLLVEINNNSLSPTSWRENARENDKEILELCAQEDYPVIIGSDAHADHNVGANSYALDLMEEIHFPEHLILNYQIDELKSYLDSDERKRER